MTKKILLLGTFLLAASLLGCKDTEHKDTLNKMETSQKILKVKKKNSI